MLHVTSGTLVPGPRSGSKFSPPLAELLVLNVVAAWVCFYLAFDKQDGSPPHKLEALVLLVLALAGHAGMGPSQFRFAPDCGVAMGLMGVPCMLASLLVVSTNNFMIASLLHASLLCSASVAVHHLLCLPISDIPSRSTSLTCFSTLAAKVAILSVRLLLPWPDRPFSVVAFCLHELFMWGVVEVPLFTASFTLGEAMIIVQALALTTADAICCTALEAGVGSSVAGTPLRAGRDAVLVVLQCGLIGAIGSGAVILPLFCREVRERRDMNGVLLQRHHHLPSISTTTSSSTTTTTTGGTSTLGGLTGSSSSLHHHHSVTSTITTSSSTTSLGRGGGGGGGADMPFLGGLMVGGEGGGSAAAAAAVGGGGPPSLLSEGGGGSGSAYMASFLVVFAAYLGAVMLPWISFMIHKNPLTWVAHFITVDDGRLKLCAFWLVLLLVFTRGIVPFSALFKLRRIMVRKLFHLLAVVMFLPATISQPRFLALSYAVALSALMVIEYVRMSRKVLWVGHLVHRFYSHFLDERDMGNLVVTHIYLLLGCAFPLWVSWLPAHANPFIPYAGILALGIGDAAAASVGSVFGRHRWPSSNRTLEGSFAMLLTMLVATLLLEQVEETRLLTLGLQPACAVVLALALLSLLEAFTCQIDNLILPVFAVTLLNLALRFSLTARQHAAAAAAEGDS